MTNTTNATNTTHIGLEQYEAIALGIEGALVVCLLIAWAFVRLVECGRQTRRWWKQRGAKTGIPQEAQFFYLVGYHRVTVYILLAYRVLGLLYFFGALTAQIIVHYVMRGRTFVEFISYISNLTILAFGLYYLLACIASTIYIVSRWGKGSASPPWPYLAPLNAIMSFLFSVVFISSLSVTTLYWGAHLGTLVGYTVPPGDFVGWLTHGGNTIILALELLFTEIAMYPSQSFLVTLVPILYLWYLLFFTSTGIYTFYPYEQFISPEGEDGYVAIFVRLGVYAGWWCAFVVVYLLWTLKMALVGLLHRGQVVVSLEPFELMEENEDDEGGWNEGAVV